MTYNTNNQAIMNQATTNQPAITTKRTRSMLGFASGIAATLLAGTVFAAVSTSAAPADAESTFVPITPCRMLDTRSGPDNVGARATPLGADETYTLIVGDPQGDCDLPGKISGIAFNATALNATNPTFVSFSPAGVAIPNTSNLNVLPDQPPTPNKVDVKLGVDSELAMYNAFGTVDLIIDVVGYYSSTGLSEMNKTIAGAALSIKELRAQQPFAVGVTDTNTGLGKVVTSASKALASIEVPEGFRGDVVVNFSATVAEPTAGESVQCTLNTVSDEMSDLGMMRFSSPGADGNQAVIAATQVFSIDNDVDQIHAVCDADDVSLAIGSSLTGMFFPKG